MRLLWAVRVLFVFYHGFGLRGFGFSFLGQVRRNDSTVFGTKSKESTCLTTRRSTKLRNQQLERRIDDIFAAAFIDVFGRQKPTSQIPLGYWLLVHSLRYETSIASVEGCLTRTLYLLDSYTTHTYYTQTIHFQLLPQNDASIRLTVHPTNNRWQIFLSSSTWKKITKYNSAIIRFNLHRWPQSRRHIINLIIIVMCTLTPYSGQTRRRQRNN